ncbi:MAG TPA: class I SAM-dependent methyltransferase [Phycisphaerae bacterium]|nr:class I SAM-dependent methyltransferase [Phycisphaerae bacterium]HUU83875.1 class I SAM-dependent methyltransferase [Phycisphaerae bacterium]
MALWYECGNGMLRTVGFARKRSSLTALFCCPGPSLANVQDAELHIPGVMVAAINTAYPHIRPDVWAGLDKPMAYDGNLWREPFIKVLRGGYQDYNCATGRVGEAPNTFFGDAERGVSATEMLGRRGHDVKFIMSGGTFTFMMHLLVWMGHQCIYLVGCDFGGAKDYHDDRTLDGHERTHNRTLYGQIAKWLPAFAATAASHGIEIISATDDSPINARMRHEPLQDVLRRLKERPAVEDGRVLHCKKAEICQWAQSRATFPEGIIVGCDAREEALLPGWYDSLRRHDRRPVLFCNFGMTASMAEWCRARGQYDAMVAQRRYLSGWWLKPAAILRSPFEKSLWLDVDCEVGCSLDAAFAALDAAPLALRPSQHRLPSPKALPEDVPSYNSGVLAVRHGEPAIEWWARRVMLDRDKFPGDQDVLSQVMHDHGIEPGRLPPELNWFWRDGDGPAVHVHHWTGNQGKAKALKRWGDGLIFVHIKGGNTGDAACCPAHYMEFGRPLQIVDWRQVTETWMKAHAHANMIVGGGGLVSDPAKLSILSRPGGLRVAWGIGRAGAGNGDYGPYARSLGLFDLCGVRDAGAPFELLPCPTCLHPALGNPIEPTHEVVVYNHMHHPFEKLPNAPCMNNALPDAETAIRFLASGATVVTSSYHGALWAMWLGRKVLIQQPWSAKFYTFPKKPGVVGGRDWQKSLSRAVDFAGDGLLPEARERTIAFHERVMERMAEHAGCEASPGNGQVRIRPRSRADLLAFLPQGSVGAEVGVKTGDGATTILQVVRPRRLHLIDCWTHQPQGTYVTDKNNVEQSAQETRHLAVYGRFTAEIRSGQVVIHRLFSGDAMAALPPASLDWIFIDADHSYEAALADLRLAGRAVKPSGWIMGHDYVRQAHFGVIEAVKQFESEGPWRLCAVTEGRYPSFAMRSAQTNPVTATSS